MPVFFLFLFSQRETWQSCVLNYVALEVYGDYSIKWHMKSKMCRDNTAIHYFERMNIKLFSCFCGQNCVGHHHLRYIYLLKSLKALHACGWTNRVLLAETSYCRFPDAATPLIKWVLCPFNLYVTGIASASDEIALLIKRCICYYNSTHDDSCDRGLKPKLPQWHKAAVL